MLEKCISWVLILSRLLALGSLLRSVGSSSLESGIIKETSTEEHPEEIVSIEVVLFFVELLTVPLLKIFFRTMLIIEFSLLRIAKACECLTDFFEGFCGLRSLVLIWMELQSKFSISFLYLILVCGFRYIQYFIIILLAHNHSTAFHLYQLVNYARLLLTSSLE